jgi:hypothetical protein
LHFIARRARRDEAAALSRIRRNDIAGNRGVPLPRGIPQFRVMNSLQRDCNPAS